MVKKKECYTKKTKTGKNYTTCVEGQKKPKTIKIKKKKVATKPKKTAPKNMSAGMSMLMTSGLMAKVGAYAIPKKEKERRKERAVKLVKKSMKSYETRVMVFTDRMKRYRPARPVLELGRRSIIDGEWTGRKLGPLNPNRPTAAMTKKMLKKAKNMKKKYTEIINNFTKTIGKTPRQARGTTRSRDLMNYLDITINVLEKHMKYYAKIKT